MNKNCPKCQIEVICVPHFKENGEKDFIYIHPLSVLGCDVLDGVRMSIESEFLQNKFKEIVNEKKTLRSKLFGNRFNHFFNSL